MITMPFMMGARAKEEVWEITVNTEATTTGAKTTGIPISLYNQPGITVSVNWGDGTNSVLTQASYTQGDYTPSTHEYANPGTYTLQIASTKWGNLYIDTLESYSTGSLTHLQCFRDSLIEVGTMPKLAGAKYRLSPDGKIFNNFNSLPCCFYGCSNLGSIPENLFINNTSVTSFGGSFYGCTNITTIPENLFGNNTSIISLMRCFQYCSSITNFTLRLYSLIISSASNFITLSSGTNRTIYVPSGSTTETTFNSVADSLGLTIIGE